MIQQYSNPSSLGEPSLYTEDGSNTSANMNGKRPRSDLSDDQVEEPPRKLARLGSDHPSEREKPQQPSNHVANTPDQKQGQDFVDGPGHLAFFIDEHGKRCPAICFNKGLLSTFIYITVLSREVQETDNDLKQAQLELENIKMSNQSADAERAKQMMEEAIKMQEDAEVGILGMVEARRRCEELAKDSRWSKMKLDNSKDLAQLVIEQILGGADFWKLPSLNPAPAPEKTAGKAQQSEAPGSIRTTSTADSYSPVDTEPQLTPRQLALRNLRLASEDLSYGQRQFNFILEGYEEELAEERRYRQERYPGRPASITQTEVDLTCLQKKQYATRRLIEAEAARDSAEQDALDLDLSDILPDPQAYYRAEFYNEFPPLHTPRRPSLCPEDRTGVEARVEAWMASVPDSAMADPQRREEVEPVGSDDWEANSVEISDSVSVVAMDMYRKKIDQWQEISGQVRGAEAWRRSRGTVRRNARRRGRGRRYPNESARTR